MMNDEKIMSADGLTVGQWAGEPPAGQERAVRGLACVVRLD